MITLILLDRGKISVDCLPIPENLRIFAAETSGLSGHLSAIGALLATTTTAWARTVIIDSPFCLSVFFVLPDFRGYYYTTDAEKCRCRASDEVVFTDCDLKTDISADILT